MSQNPSPFSEPGQPQYGQPLQPPPKKGTNVWLIVGIVAAVSLIPMMLCCVGLMLPAVQAAREAARRMSCQNNMMQIGLALQEYHAVHQTLPPAYTVDARGNKLHSWRTLILPYLGQEGLHRSIDFNKPWDDPANAQAAQTVIDLYHCPSLAGDASLTTYVAVVDPSGAMSGPTGTQFRSVTDGLANTLLLAETDSGNAVHWMSPEDIGVPEFLDAGTRRESGHLGGAHVVMGDGAVIFMTDSTDRTLREALVSKDGGEVVGF